jgi:hypothetical protein
MDEPPPVGSAAATFRASFHVFSTNSYNFHTVSAMVWYRKGAVEENDKLSARKFLKRGSYHRGFD